MMKDLESKSYIFMLFEWPEKLEPENFIYSDSAWSFPEAEVTSVPLWIEEVVCFCFVNKFICILF